MRRPGSTTVATGLRGAGRAGLLALVAAGATPGCAPAPHAHAAQDAAAATARYLANEGVLLTSGHTQIAFDPIFRQDYGQYRLLPEHLERALFAGEPPFEELDAVFVSHYHEDHFSPADLWKLLERRPGVRLYAPAQAVASMGRRLADDPETASRITGIDLAPTAAPLVIDEGGLRVEAVRVPHAGWPERSVQVHNLAYRVTLDGRATVVHLGDADARDVHFAPHADFWRSRPTHMAFPPYWFFFSPEGLSVLDDRLAAERAVGVHVPADMPESAEERPAELRGHDLFLVPGETREIRPRGRSTGDPGGGS